MKESDYMKFIVAKEFFNKVDDACFGVVIAKGIDNHQSYEWIQKMLEDSMHEVVEKYRDVKVKETEEIGYYREAFQKIGINPNKFMCSIEALVSRIAKGGQLPHINPIVDLGNAISLKYCIPLGAHDIGGIDGAIEIREAKEDDIFIPFGASESEKVDVGEIVYASKNKIKTRRWTWRQGEEGKITEETCDVFFPIDGFVGKNDDKVIALRDELAKIVKEKLNAEVKVGFIDKDNREFEF